MTKIAAHFSRRHFIGTVAAGTGITLCHNILPYSAFAATSSGWKGTMLGAELTVQLFDGSLHDQAFEHIIQSFLQDIKDLDGSCPESQLSHLNRNKILYNPSNFLIRILQQASYYHQVTDGLFNPLRVQSGTSSHSVSLFPSLSVERHKISISVKNGFLDLGGLVQGYALDQLALQLTESGYRSFELSLGNIVLKTLDNKGSDTKLSYQATAFLDMTTGKIFHPRKDIPLLQDRSLKVLMDKAADTDAFSTVFAMTDAGQISRIMAKSAKGTVTLVKNGQETASQIISVI